MLEAMSGVLWLLITVVMVAVLGAAIAYGVIQHRRRRRRLDPRAEEHRAREIVGQD